MVKLLSGSVLQAIHLAVQPRRMKLFELRLCTAIAVLAPTALCLLAGCAMRQESRDEADAGHLQRFEFIRPEMGVPFRIVLYAGNSNIAKASANAAFQRIEQLNSIMSDYDTDSELSRLSRSAGEGRAVPVSADLWFVLNRAQEMAARSDGAFDVTVGPVVNHWRKARREKKMPRAESLAGALATVGWRMLQLEAQRRTATLLVAGMKLDLGGIAKGYALDEALAVLRARGITRALVTGGGDMVAGAAPPGAKGWRIEIAPLEATNAPPARFVLLHSAALATSGDVFQHVEIDGTRYSHIVDPRTGIGLTDHGLVTVISRDATTADALATAVSVLGPEKGLKLIETESGAACLFVRKPGHEIEIMESKRFNSFLDVRSQERD